MRTIAVIGLKGGSGKTTLTTHIALAAHLRGRKTLVVDIDPQRSSAEVLSARTAEGPECFCAAGSELFAAQVTAVGQGVDALFIDTAAGAVEDVGQAIVLADLSLLVLRPTLLDIAAAVRTIDIVRRLRKPSIVVLNQAPVARDGVEPPVVKRALKALEFMRLVVAPTILRSRAVYQTALENGRSAEESLDPIAAKEVGELWAFIERFAFASRERQPASVGA